MSRSVQKAVKESRSRVNDLPWHGNCPRALSNESKIIKKESVYIKHYVCPWKFCDFFPDTP